MNATEANARLTGDLKLVVRDAEELLKATAGQVSDKVKEVRERLASALEAAKASCDGLQEQGAKVARATDQVIRHHPYESAGVAFGVGLLIGVLLGRR